MLPLPKTKSIFHLLSQQKRKKQKYKKSFSNQCKFVLILSIFIVIQIQMYYLVMWKYPSNLISESVNKVVR